ncbi:hypothetical protein [Streptomyces coffeae]|uniref:Uncharacterized protein n=1 Tax=Streptomyces coffeae TaxID=621382 RepID=A0ABS1NKJ8_9ACTN|nr:hypothetical protein [Streptomyces coffeae]MBL1100447.1 hypothetical protein [Streptomyces coffeae]
MSGTCQAQILPLSIEEAMRSTIGSPVFADSLMIEALDEFGLEVRYVRAEGNTLYHFADDGTEAGVFDAAGGDAAPAGTGT